MFESSEEFHFQYLDLPVQLCRLDVAEPVWVVRGQQENVRRNELVVLHSDDVADLRKYKRREI